MDERKADAELGRVAGGVAAVVAGVVGRRCCRLEAQVLGRVRGRRWRSRRSGARRDVVPCGIVSLIRRHQVDAVLVGAVHPADVRLDDRGHPVLVLDDVARRAVDVVPGGLGAW